MYGFLFRPRWLLFHVVVVAGITAMMFAGFWQLDRLSERKEFNARVIERSQTEPSSLRSVLSRIEDGSLTPDEAEWLPVVVDGTYLPDQVLNFNKSQGGRAGDNVLTAAVTDDGDTVIVNRGFIPLGIDVPAAPATAVRGRGYVRLSEVRERGGVTDTDDGEPLTEIRRVDLERLARQFPGDVAPVYVQLIASDPPIAVGDPEPVVLPELSNGPHLSYAIQWFTFSLAVVVGWVLAVRRSLKTRLTAEASG
ncbi:MAG: SURF1 family protein [Ilumatobacter sp.]|uniref:SURF1 family protein n=1 Tax=Ilumatobacter sp. TaxID=1967498 RepID=UPI0032975362